MKSRQFSLTMLLIVVNVVVFFLSKLLFIFGDADYYVQFLAINPHLFFEGYVWTLITSMFMHVSFTHLFVNMVSLFFIGSFVERIIGRKRFLWFYLISGIVAGLFFVLLPYLGLVLPFGDAIFGPVDSFAVGASGALFGLGGLLAVLIPRLRVLVFFVIPMPLWLGMAVLLFGFWIISAVGGLPIGNTAHFGGLVAGLIYGFYLRKKYRRKVKMLNRWFVR